MTKDELDRYLSVLSRLSGKNCAECKKTDQKEGKTMRKVHHKGGCLHGARNHTGLDSTEEVSEVTCKICLEMIERYTLRSRSEFPAMPTFTTKKTRYGSEFTCPVCRANNLHGTGDGHRISHCGCWKEGYVIKLEDVDNVA